MSVGIQEILFYFFAGIALAGGAGVLLFRHLLYAVFSLMVCFISLAGIFIFAMADFIAIAQIMIYVGGILVLLIFGLMYAQKLSEKPLRLENYSSWLGLTLASLFFLVFARLLNRAQMQQSDWIITSQPKTLETTLHVIGIDLMSRYLLAFELAAVILLVALIGAIYIAKDSSTQKLSGQ